MTPLLQRHVPPAASQPLNRDGWAWAGRIWPGCDRVVFPVSNGLTSLTVIIKTEIGVFTILLLTADFADSTAAAVFPVSNGLASSTVIIKTEIGNFKILLLSNFLFAKTQFKLIFVDLESRGTNACSIQFTPHLRRDLTGSRKCNGCTDGGRIS